MKVESDLDAVVPEGERGALSIRLILHGRQRLHRTQLRAVRSASSPRCALLREPSSPRRRSGPLADQARKALKSGRQVRTRSLPGSRASAFQAWEAIVNQTRRPSVCALSGHLLIFWHSDWNLLAKHDLLSGPEPVPATWFRVERMPGSAARSARTTAPVRAPSSRPQGGGYPRTSRGYPPTSRGYPPASRGYPPTSRRTHR